MNVEEIRKMKDQLRESIIEKIEIFECATGTVVTDLSLNNICTFSLNGGENLQSHNLEIKVEL